MEVINNVKRGLAALLVFAVSPAVVLADDAMECDALFLSSERFNSDAYRVCKRAAEQGEAWAQSLLGMMYRDGGEGVVRNYREAVKWFRLAAEQGESAAQSNLGAAYYNGEGVTRNRQEAYIWFLLAASQGSVYAHEFLSKVEQELTPSQINAAQEEAARRAAAYQ